MAGGTPVVVSDIDIFREIGADAALYFDPRDPKSFATAVLRLEDPTEWSRLSALSRKRSGDFSWDRSAAALLGTLTSVYEARRTASAPG
jgi:glycosyltransferase involved in cell wall biosynthesis